MPVIDHIHIYEFSHKTKEGVERFRCADPACVTSTWRKEQIAGKQSRCPDCDSMFILTSDSIRLKHPKCTACRKTKKAEVLRNTKMKMQGVLDVFDRVETGGGI